MREILFRAKDMNGNWFEGMPHGYANLPPSEIGLIFEAEDGASYIKRVKKETLCQFTGLLDKDGKRIWEGDIIQHWNLSPKPVSFQDGGFGWTGALGDFIPFAGHPHAKELGENITRLSSIHDKGDQSC